MKKADIDSTLDTLEGEKPTGGGLYIPGKERILFRHQERSRFGLDTLASAKRAESKAYGAFKPPREGLTSVAASLDDEEKSTVTHAASLDDEDRADEDGANVRERPIRRYRESVASEASESESFVTREGEVTDDYRSRESVRSEYSRVDRADSRSERVKGSHRYNDDDSKEWSRGADHGRYERRNSGERYERGSSGGRYERGSSSGRYERDSGSEYGRKRSRHEGSKRTPGRSDWDDGTWEWQDTPHRDGYRGSNKRYQPSPSPMLVGASPDARLVSPWQTPRSGAYASPWDCEAPSPIPIRAAGSSVRSSTSQVRRQTISKSTIHRCFTKLKGYGWR